MRKRLVPALALAALLLTRPVSGLTLLPVTVDDLITRAARIAYGRVVDVNSTWTPDRRTIESTITLELLEAYKGAAVERVQFALPGGQSGGLIVAVPGVPVLREGDLLVVFLGPSAAALPRPLGLSQGLWRVQADLTGQLRVPGGVPLDALKSRVRGQVGRR